MFPDCANNCCFTCLFCTILICDEDCPISSKTRIELPVNSHHLVLTQEQVYLFLHQLAALGGQCKYFDLHLFDWCVSCLPSFLCLWRLRTPPPRNNGRQLPVSFSDCFFLGKELAIKRDGTRGGCPGWTVRSCCDQHSGSTPPRCPSPRHDPHGPRQ